MTFQPPPVPADADLTDFKFMPLEVARLRRSKAWLICKRRPELAFYMLNLWTAAWHERPAGSLEDDDDVLADAALCSPDKWPKVRADAMRGWFKAADGRLYHPVVAEKVMDSWHGKAVARWRKECDRIRKENHKRKEKGLLPLDFPEEPPRNATTFPAESSGIPAERQGIPAEKPLKGEGREREGKGEVSKDLEAAAASSSVAACATTPEAPVPVEMVARDDDPGPIPDFLRASSASRVETDEAYALWVPVAYDLRIPDPGFLNSERRAELAARLTECGGIEGWKLALENLRTAEFLRDDDDPSKPKHWVNLKNLCKPENFVGLMEGRYAERRSPQSRSADSGSPTVADGVAAAFTRRYAQPG